ncbi:MAG: hypothetical protein [Olavius algarvensis Gamma 1 endosymbiont]|nr:MAG: hypothetical protein [Olavius algarvensis Gamma 1 endosymbiont]
MSVPRMNMVSVIIPTYQERDNIESAITGIAEAMGTRRFEIIVVDDNSPDGTADSASGLAERFPVRVLRREGKLGRGAAVRFGFECAAGGIVGVMDADLQHPPATAVALIHEIEQGHDIAVASRYVRGGGIEDWPLSRRLISRAASLLTRMLTSVRDSGSGCFFARKAIIEEMRSDTEGYKTLLCLLADGHYSSVKEIPYILRPRRHGKSKLDGKEVIRYLRLLCRLHWRRLKRN